MEPIVSIHVDLLLIGRCFAALFWGIIYAVFIQYNRYGQFIAAERTWLSVVIGIGADLLISFNSDWPTTCLVIAFSSIGIIVRSLTNESKGKPPSGYKVLWGIEDALVMLRDLIGVLEEIANHTQKGEQVARVSKAVTLAQLGREVLVRTRRGDYESGRKNGK